MSENFDQNNSVQPVKDNNVQIISSFQRILIKRQYILTHSTFWPIVWLYVSIFDILIFYFHHFHEKFLFWFNLCLLTNFVQKTIQIDLCDNAVAANFKYFKYWNLVLKLFNIQCSTSVSVSIRSMILLLETFGNKHGRETALLIGRLPEILPCNHSLDTRTVFIEFSEYVENSGVVVYWEKRSFKMSSRGFRMMITLREFWHYNTTIYW